MAKKSKLTKSKSIYTIKNKHSVTNSGVIYENDHFTIIPNDGIFDDDDGAAIFSESNFKYKVDTNNNSKKRHIRGEFIKNDLDTEVWTLETISAHTVPVNDSKIVLKPNYTSLRDFAYYGSAVELVKATIQDIIKRFPGGLYYNNNKLTPPIKIGNETYYYVSNEFEIDCWTGGGLISSGNVKNPMRILAASYKNYVLGDGTTECSCPVFTSKSTCLNSIIGSVEFGAGTFYVYMDGNGDKHLVTTKNTASGVIIKPKQEFVEKFWESLDDFERVLLNRDTTPVYKAVFETPYSNDNGFYYDNKSYIWPTVGNDGFTPDLTSGAFQGYLASLLSLAEFHDTYDTDNIWRMMTHESIKNLDWTHTSNDGETVEDLSDFDTKGISAMIRVYGRQFDDIKRYADNIKHSNSVSYDEKNNMPDYFLSDTVENDGWEAKCITPEASSTTDDYHNKVNSEFLRRMALSSNYIQSLKGTRRGIEVILGMFGYKYDNDSDGGLGTFTIEEKVATNNYLDYEEAYKLRGYYESVYEVPDAPHFMDGFPVALVKYEHETEGLKEYLIPWMEKGDKNFYFQSKGGWGKVSDKPINLQSLTTATTIDSNGVIPIYGETQPYMKFADTIDDMLMINNKELYENMICYVADISDIEQEYTPGEGEDCSEYSHYFSLKNVALSTRCGFVSNDIYNCYGWKNVHPIEIMECNSKENGGTDDGKRVVYLESLRAEYKGNNPHAGFGHYDDGGSYLEKYTNLFKDAFEKGSFDHIKGTEDYNKVANGYGFDIFDGITDNKKCAFFLDYSDSEKDINLITVNEEDDITDWNSKNYISLDFPDVATNIKNVADESQANGVMNVKNLIINFNIGGNTYFKNYIQTVVMKYLEEMIPSTAILEYRFDNKVAFESTELPYGSGSFEFIRTAHAAVSRDDDSVTIWREYPIPISEM